MVAAASILSPGLLKWITIKSLMNPYFQDLIFKDFDEYAYCVNHESLHYAMKYEAPVWFATIDPEPQELSMIDPELIIKMNKVKKYWIEKGWMWTEENSIERIKEADKKLSQIFVTLDEEETENEYNLLIVFAMKAFYCKNAMDLFR